MTADVKLLPLPEMDIYTLGSGVGLRDVRHTPVGFSQKKMSEYARANVSRTIAAKNAELVELRSAIEELRAEVERAQQPTAVDGWVLEIKPDRDGETGVWAVNGNYSIWVSAVADKQGSKS